MGIASAAVNHSVNLDDLFFYRIENQKAAHDEYSIAHPRKHGIARDGTALWEVF